MKTNKQFKLTLTVFLLSLIYFKNGWAQVEEHAIPTQYIIQFHTAEGAELFLQNKSIFISKECLSPRMNIWLLETKSTDENFLSNLKKDKSIHLAQYNHQVKKRNLIPNDPGFSTQWSLHNTGQTGGIVGDDVHATEAWALSHNTVSALGDTLVLAIIESTLDVHHEDISWFVNYHEIDSNGIDDDGNGYIDDRYGWNCFTNTGAMVGSDAHANFVCGIASAKTNNGIGISSTSFGVKALPIAGQSELESVVIKAYDYVINMRSLYDATNGAKGAYIVATNSSFGVDRGQPSAYPIWCALYDSLGKFGILNVCATANGNWNVDDFGDIPTACPSDFIIAVTNTNNIDTKITSAAYGKINVDLGAPGMDIYSTLPGNAYGYNSYGTSYSTPHVTGAIGAMFGAACPLLLSNYKMLPAANALLFKKYLLDGVDKVPSLNQLTTSNGRLNLYRAILNVQSYNCNGCNFPFTPIQTNLVCAGDSSASISINSPASNIQYHWSTGDSSHQIQSLKAGVFTLTLTQNGCSQQQSFFVENPYPITITGYNSQSVTSINGNIIILAKAGGDSLVYALNNLPYSDSHVLSVDSPGFKTVHIKDVFSGCVKDTLVFVSKVNGIENETISPQIIFPNPVQNQLHILSEENADVEIFDILGKKLTQFSLKKGENLIDLKAYNSGNYLMKIISAQDNWIYKVVKE